MHKRLSACLLLWLALSGFTSAEERHETAIALCAQQGVMPGDAYYGECMERTISEMAERDYEASAEENENYNYVQPMVILPRPVNYAPHYVYASPPAYYVQDMRPLNKGEHFINENGQYCKLTHGKRIMCK